MRAFAAGEQDAQRLPVAASPRLGEVLPGERFPGCACGVEPVGLGAVAAGRARRPVDLDYPLALLEQEAGQSGAEAARALDRPYPLSRRPLAHEAQQTPVAARVCGHRRLRDHGSMCTPPPCASRGACRRRSRTPPTCQHAIETSTLRLTLLVPAWAKGTARQDCDGSHPTRADRLLIRPARGDQAGAGSDRETDPHEETLNSQGSVSY